MKIKINTKYRHFIYNFIFSLEKKETYLDNHQFPYPLSSKSKVSLSDTLGVITKTNDDE
jgi:hypothetical protein